MQFDVRRFDVYRKIPKDLTQPTTTGAYISVASILFIICLLLSELTSFLYPETVSELFVDDPTKLVERIPISIDVTLPKMKCDFIGLDIQDDMGRHEVGYVDSVIKDPLNDGEGCRFKAKFQVNKVPGNFHLSTHASSEQPDSPDMTHLIHHVTLGDQVPEAADLPGSFNPLINRDKREANPTSSHDYFMKVVPTIFENFHGYTIYPYQYTFAYRDYIQYGHGHRFIPAIWFRYDLSPITVKYHERRKPIYSFLTTLCAIVGGTFTVAGIIDSLIFSASEIFKKFEIGKLN
ncbi:DgyrCDS5411 [Dimorphilus gyrociliatus]|uniref:DgyrCDS5411 n=1 Tax=Dimorphilus gyrociliatus TaxID=2664684 RepID=A0A7I8VM53_9ANNE|nr:DgyrCDS5411 [Dimorphilus gyrociliatus]